MAEFFEALGILVAPVWALLGVAAAPYLQSRRDEQTDRREALKERRKNRVDAIERLQEAVMQLRIALDQQLETERARARGGLPVIHREERPDGSLASETYGPPFEEAPVNFRLSYNQVELLGCRVADENLRDCADQTLEAANWLHDTLQDPKRKTEHVDYHQVFEDHYQRFKESVRRALLKTE